MPTLAKNFTHLENNLGEFEKKFLNLKKIGSCFHIASSFYLGQPKMKRREMWVKENSCCDNNDYCKLAEDLFWDPEGWKRHVMHHSSRLKCTWKEEWWDVRIRELLGSRQLMEIGQGSTTTRPIIGFSKETRLKIAADFSNSKSNCLSSKQHFLKVGFQNEGEREEILSTFQG